MITCSGALGAFPEPGVWGPGDGKRAHGFDNEVVRRGVGTAHLGLTNRSEGNARGPLRSARRIFLLDRRHYLRCGRHI